MWFQAQLNVEKQQNAPNHQVYKKAAWEDPSHFCDRQSITLPTNFSIGLFSKWDNVLHEKKTIGFLRLKMNDLSLRNKVIQLGLGCIAIEILSPFMKNFYLRATIYPFQKKVDFNLNIERTIMKATLLVLLLFLFVCLVEFEKQRILRKLLSQTLILLDERELIWYWHWSYQQNEELFGLFIRNPLYKPPHPLKLKALTLRNLGDVLGMVEGNI